MQLDINKVLALYQKRLAELEHQLILLQVENEQLKEEVQNQEKQER